MGENTRHFLNLRDRLLSISQLRQDIRFDKYQAYGEGTVQVSATPEQIIWSEQGFWKPPTGKKIPFTNTYYWKSLPNKKMEIGHLRLGKDQPVKLVEIYLTETENKWKSLSPHLCGEDTYAAEVKLLERSMLLCWDIRGPIKRQVLRYTYF